MDDPGDVATRCRALDECMDRFARGHIDGCSDGVEAGIAQHFGRRIGVGLVQVGEDDLLASTDAPGNRLTDLPRPDDDCYLAQVSHLPGRCEAERKPDQLLFAMISSGWSLSPTPLCAIRGYYPSGVQTQ
jgi:hypothetical protein